ncbi:MAG: hypothetical protein A2Z97_03495 [Bdellovibrionales bacterium GWB1_52_6]|nr:MAG: hypothetical protein A2Z97_03495 [Bdellovibrionales bacterium GWB1_52_6]OFZ04039.1 MAG: hypothetical protein A2X97_14650 [Bdellovibrionales bacterium GWA1_52_35]HCM39876.1 hypothetical protein [Bdellovibrionales bacterium]
MNINRFLPLLLLPLFAVAQAQAGVFNTVHFVSPGEFALGGEAELTFSDNSGAGINFRFTEGLNELMNVTGLIGTGGGDRKFRFGGNVVFDFFPDIEDQPGIGIAAQGIYYRLPNVGQFEATAIPYIHKSFVSGANEIEPFVAIPFGMAFSEGKYKAISSVVLGSMFKGSEQIRYSMEFGIAVNHADSYLSGGFTYYH